MKINANFFAHHKTRRLAKTLGNDGVVSNMKDSDIELVSEWNGDAGMFVYSLADIGFLDERDGGTPTFPPHEQCDYQVELESCNDSDDYAALIRKGIEVIPVDLFGTGKSADELRKENMGAHYDDYNAMMARTRGNTG